MVLAKPSGVVLMGILPEYRCRIVLLLCLKFAEIASAPPSGRNWKHQYFVSPYLQSEGMVYHYLLLVKSVHSQNPLVRLTALQRFQIRVFVRKKSLSYLVRKEVLLWNIFL